MLFDLEADIAGQHNAGSKYPEAVPKRQTSETEVIMRNVRLAVVMVMAAVGVAGSIGCAGTSDWRGRLKSELPAMGHRNWIVVADAAYPKQTAAGIETVATGAGQIEVLTLRDENGGIT